MNLPRPRSMPYQPAGSACGQGRRNQAELQIAPDAFSWEAIQGLVDDWLVPMIVEQIIIRLRERQGASINFSFEPYDGGWAASGNL